MKKKPVVGLVVSSSGIITRTAINEVIVLAVTGINKIDVVNITRDYIDMPVIATFIRGKRSNIDWVADISPRSTAGGWSICERYVVADSAIDTLAVASRTGGSNISFIHDKRKWFTVDRCAINTDGSVHMNGDIKSAVFTAFNHNGEHGMFHIKVDAGIVTRLE